MNAHLTTRDLLYFHGRILDEDGRVIFGRSAFIPLIKRRKIQRHLASCIKCQDKVMALSRPVTHILQPSSPQRKAIADILNFLRGNPLLALAASLLIVTGFTFLAEWFGSHMRSEGLLVTSKYAESNIPVLHSSAEIGSVRLAPFSTMNMPAPGKDFNHLQLFEGAAEITIRKNLAGFMVLQGDHGSVRISWAETEATENGPLLQFWIFDRDESSGAPDFFVKVIHGKLMVPGVETLAQREFSGGETFMVSQNNLISYDK